MLEFDALPLVGVGPVNFGMSRREVRRVLADLGQRKALKRGPNTDCFFKNAFQVHYSSDDAVEFIETASESLFRVLFHGQCLHELIADEAVKFVSKFGEYDRNDRELGYSYVFPTLQISLWRAVLPEGPDDTVGRYFEAVGFGKTGYFNSEA